MQSWKRAALGAPVPGFPRRTATPRPAMFGADERSNAYTGVIRRASGTYERCKGPCRDTYPLHTLDRFGLCSLCRAEQATLEGEAREESYRRFPVPPEHGYRPEQVLAALERNLERVLEQAHG